MTTLPIRAAELPQTWAFPSLSRFFAALASIVEAYSEALEQAHEVRQRYPFASE
jgi:hypothetical protein